MARLTLEYRKQIRALIDEGSLDLDSDKALLDALDTIDALEADLVAWKNLQFQAHDACEELSQEIATFKESMACGHPKACWIECENHSLPLNADGCHWYREPGEAEVSLPCKSHCSACEHERLELAAALRKAIDVTDSRPFEKDKCGGDRCVYCELNRAVARIAALIPPVDASLLDAHDKELMRLKEIGVIQHVKGGWNDGCMCEPCIFVRELVQEKVNAAVLAESEWWFESIGTIGGLKIANERLAANRIKLTAPR